MRSFTFSVYEGRRELVVAEDDAPLRELDVGRDYHRAPLVARAHDLEEQPRALDVYGDVDEWLTEDVNDTDISFLFEQRGEVDCALRAVHAGRVARPPRRRRAGRRNGRSPGLRPRENRPRRRQRAKAVGRRKVAVRKPRNG